MKSLQKQLLVLGPSVSEKTAETLAEQCDAAIPVSIGFFGSGEPFVELFPKQQADHAANAAQLLDARAIILQSTGAPVGDNCQHLLLAAHTLKTYGASEVVAVLPFAAFARQDRPFDKRFTSIAGDLFPQLLKAAGVDKVVTVTPHSQAAMKFYRDVFGADFTALTTTDLFAADIARKYGADALTLSIGAPDGADKAADEGQLRAKDIVSKVFNAAAAADAAMFRIVKTHTGMSETKILRFDGDVLEKDCVIVDDMIDGGSTTLNAAALLKEKGARSASAYVTHAILSGNALEKILSAKGRDGRYALDRLVVTDTLPDVAEKLAALAEKEPALASRVEILSAGPLIANAIGRRAAPAVRPPSPPSA